MNFSLGPASKTWKLVFWVQRMTCAKSGSSCVTAMLMASVNLNEMIRLLAAAILFHELLSTCKWGTDYLSKCVAPVLGLELHRLTHSLIHSVLMIVAGWMCLFPDARLFLPMFILLSATIASYSIRLSNHLIVVWFFILAVTIDLFCHATLTATSVLSVRALVLLTYIFAAFHKLNPDYFTPTSSCAVRLVRFYFQDKLTNSRANRVIIICAIWVPVICEAAIPMLLLFKETRAMGVLAAICLQSLFGFARNAPFSVVMYAGLTLFLPPANLSITTVLVVCGLGAWIGFRYSMWKVYPKQKLALVLHTVFGAITAYMFIWVITTYHNRLDNIQHHGNLQWLVIAVLLLLFAVNALSPFYTSKTEFCLAMFSNLRPDRRVHFVVKQSPRQFGDNEYVEILSMQGIPELSSYSQSSFNYRLVRSFKPYEGRKYLKYYLVESINYLRNQLAADFIIELIDDEQQLTVSSGTDLSTLKYRKTCLMPAVIPNNPNTPYCN